MRFDEDRNNEPDRAGIVREINEDMCHARPKFKPRTGNNIGRTLPIIIHIDRPLIGRCVTDFSVRLN